MARPKPTSNVGAALTNHIVRHGLTGNVPIIPGVESPEEYRAHIDAVIADLAPEGALERDLAGRIADLLWRIRRAGRYEVEAITLGRERVDFDYARGRFWDGRPASVGEAKERAVTARRIARMLESLMKVPPETILPSEDVDRLLEELTQAADLDLDAFMETVDLGDDDDESPWTATQLMTVLRAMAKLDGSAFEDALATFVHHAKVLAAGAEEAIAAADKEIEGMRRERLMPGARELELILRYETSLNRMLFQYINQLEATQARRHGAPVAPTLRLQHYGGRNG